MRLIFTILLIGLFKADAQMVINASAPYRPLVSANLLLDDYPNAAAAYSLRKLDKDYTGAAIRVRKDTTGQPEQDIFFVGNELDTAALKSFLNARSGFVVTWYDQSGNARNATQATQANQPRIANLGVIDRASSRPTIQFNSHLLQVTMTGIDTVTRLQTYNVINPALAAAANTTTEILWGYAGGGTNSAPNTSRGIAWGPSTVAIPGEKFTMYFSNATLDAGRLGNSTYTRAANTTILHITENKTNGTSWYTNEGADNSFDLSSIINTNTNTSPANAERAGITTFWIKSIQGSTNAVAQKYSELIVYYATFPDYVTGVRSNINAYYGIY